VDEPGTFIEDVTRHLRDAGLRATPAVITRIKPPVVEGITNELVVRFHESVPRKLAIHIAIEHGLELVRQLGSSDNTYLLRSSKALNYHLLKTGLRLLEDARVEEVEPQLIHQIHLDQYTPNDPLWSKQDCLQLIGCEDAWEALGNVDAKWRGGSPDVTLAILDGHGLDVNHPEFAGTVSNGQPKIVTAYDFQVMSAQSASSPGGSHGTQCAGSACAAFDNGEGISGVAPNCRLIAARLPTAFTHHDVADIIRWVAGIDPHRVDFPSLPSPAADVLSLSCWSTSLATVPSTIRRAIDEVTSKGRAGKGCVVVASTGNIGHLAFSSVRPLAARPDVVAVGASTRQNPTSPVDSYYPDTSPSQTRYGITVLPETRALYSPYGLEMDLVAPSSTCCKLSNKNEYEDPVLSAVEVGKGRTDGSSGGLGKFDYDETFGGTSHATPVVAGAAALILSADPDSTRKEVVDVLRETAEEIDFGNGDPVGQWQDLDMDGIKEFSRWYGHGRVNVKKAVERAARNASERAAWGGGS
jgi:subtilisin family serine protease